jgi:hypothetical protein
MKLMKKHFYRIMASFLAMILSLGSMTAQQNPLIIPTDTIYPIVEQVQSDVSVMKRLKISGYIQAQYQKIDTSGMDSYAGGNFASSLDNRFSVRRGRIKFAYENQLSQYVLQFDVTEKGLGIKDAYAAFTEPWTKSLSLWTGVFNRPFGYEIEYSSSSRETPERTRMFQTLFPSEREVGAKLVFQPWKTSRFNYIKFDVGVFNGNGPNSETDQYKDIIAHLTFNKTFMDEKLKVGLGASYYNGGVRQVTKYVYSMGNVDTSGVHTNLKGFVADSTGTTGDKVQRQYYGLETQLSYDWVLGLTTFRGEYLWGSQPALAGSSASFTALPTGDLYVRRFSGYYLNLVQNILQTPVGIVIKYDSYDPNTDISGEQIALASKMYPKNPVYSNASKTFSAPFASTGSADIKYTTLGLGLMYRWNAAVRITAYYDIVKNETTSHIANASTIKDYSGDRTDNVLTLRLQYKF